MKLPGKFGYLWRLGKLRIIVRYGPPEGRKPHLHFFLEWGSKWAYMIPDCCYTFWPEQGIEIEAHG